MSIRMKLLLSYAAMLVIPLVLILMTTLLLVLVFHGDAQHMWNIYDTKAEAIFSDEQTDHAFSELVRTAKHDPQRLTAGEYVSEIDRELHRGNAALIVRVGDKLAYLPEDMSNRQELVAHLPPFSHAGAREREEPQHSGDEVLMLTRYDFLTADGSQASLFLVSWLDPLSYFARRTFPILFVSILAILLLTHTLLTYFVSKSIIRPLKALKNGVKRIKEGNLDSPVEVTGKDEIGQLGVAFEEMRLQLSDSLRIQQQYEENRKELIANISHDLKTPITAIKGYVDGIMEGVADTPEKTARYMRTVASKADQLDRLIDELFLYSKLDLNRLPFHFESVHFHSFVADWMEEMVFELEKKGFKVETVNKAAPGLTVMMDRDKFKRVLTNIIDNCVKYAGGADARISLSAREKDGNAVLEIRDNGLGISPEELPHIFERFYRADQSRNTQTGGSGLGLSIAKQIIDGHRGAICADSVSGQGTCISISLTASHEREQP